MDLSTIANKIASDQYADVSGVDKDIKLMVKNCFTFNPPGTPVHVCGEQLQKFWNEKWREVLAVPENEPVEEDPALDRGESSWGLVLRDGGLTDLPSFRTRTTRATTSRDCRSDRGDF